MLTEETNFLKSNLVQLHKMLGMARQKGSKWQMLEVRGLFEPHNEQATRLLKPSRKVPKKKVGWLELVLASGPDRQSTARRNGSVMPVVGPLV